LTSVCARLVVAVREVESWDSEAGGVPVSVPVSTEVSAATPMQRVTRRAAAVSAVRVIDTPPIEQSEQAAGQFSRR
jgi:hypothetical protein